MTLRRGCSALIHGPAVVSIATRASLIFADIIVIAATWLKMRSQVRDVIHLRIGTSASTVMLADGA